MTYMAYYPSILGTIMLTSDGDNLTGLWIKGQKYYAATVGEECTENPELPLLVMARKWLDSYFARQCPSLSDLPLAPKGSKFRQMVWGVLREIPYGRLMTYGDIAREVAKKLNMPSMAGQAVGGAVGHNPIAIIIPCHRVVGSSGSLTGFAGGIDKKIQLLQLEGVDMNKLFVPKRGTAL